MTTLLSVSSGAIVFRDTSGNIIFDSSEKLFQATSRHTGTKVVGSWTASYNAGSGTITDVNTDTAHSLATINADCDTVVGAFKVSIASGSQGVAGVGWFNASGSYVHYFDSSIPARTVCQSMAAFTFRASGGSLFLHERVVLRAYVGLGAPTNSLTLQQITFDYNLYVGSFI